MKKAFAILTAFLYLAVTSGLAFEIHHCMGQNAQISLVPDKSPKCSRCGMKKDSNSCCKDEVKFVKLQDSHKLSYSDYKLTVPAAILHTSHFQLPVKLLTPLIAGVPNMNSPPAICRVPLYILHGVFRV